MVFVLLEADATLRNESGIEKVSVVELQVSSNETPTQRVPNRWLCLRILNQENPRLNFIGGQFFILAL